MCFIERFSGISHTPPHLNSIAHKYTTQTAKANYIANILAVKPKVSYIAKQFNIIGSYWNKKGEDEIDIVAINEAERKILIAECKRQLSRYKPEKLREKADNMVRKLPNYGKYEVELAGFALDNLDEIMTRFLADTI